MERPNGARGVGVGEDLLSIPELHPRMRVTQNSHLKVERPESIMHSWGSAPSVWLNFLERGQGGASPF